MLKIDCGTWPKVYWRRTEYSHALQKKIEVDYKLPDCLWNLLTGYYD